MALLSWLTGALTGCGDDEPTPPPPAGPPLTLQAPEPLGPGGTLASALSPDGASVAVGTVWGVGIWDRASLRPLWFRRGSAPVRDLRFSGDGERLASLDQDGVVTLWDDTGDALSALEAEPGRHCVALSPEGDKLAVGDERGGVQVFFPLGQAPPQRLEGLDSSVNALAWSPDGQVLAACSEAGRVARWRGEEPLASIRQDHSRQCRDLAWSPDGVHVASVGRELVVSSGSAVVASWPPSKGSRMESVAFSPDGATLLTGMDQGWAQLWDAVSGEAGATLDDLFSAPSSVQLGPEGLALVQADDATLWSTEGPTRLGLIPSPASALASALSPDGALLAVASRSAISVIALESGEVLAGMSGHSHFLKGLGFTDAGELVSWSAREAITWDPRSGAEQARMAPPEGKTLEAAALRASDGRVVGASVQRPTTLTKELRLDSWAASTGEAAAPLAQLSEGLQAADTLSWSADERRLLVCGGASARVLSAGGQSFGARSDLRANAAATAWDPNGESLLSVLGTGAVVRWDSRSGETTQTLGGAPLPSGPTRLAVSPDGAWIVAAVSTRDSVILSVWTADGAQVHAALPGVKGTLQSLAFHPERPALAAGLGLPGGEGRLLLWDLPSGALSSQLDSPHGYVTALLWTPAGDALLASMNGGLARVAAR